MDYELNKMYYLSSDGYSFKYRRDKYSPMLIHVEMFKNGKVCHKQISSGGYGIDLTHSQIINELEAKISLKQLDPTGLKQTVNHG